MIASRLSWIASLLLATASVSNAADRPNILLIVRTTSAIRIWDVTPAKSKRPIWIGLRPREFGLANSMSIQCVW